MSLTTPTTAQISQVLVSQLEEKINSGLPFMPRAFCRVLAILIAGVFVTLWKYAGWGWLQIFPATADFESSALNGNQVSPLIEWGRLIGVGDPLGAGQAEYLVTVPVLDQSGSLAVNELLLGRNGVTYQVLESVPLNASTVTAHVRAVADGSGGDGSGEQGNLAIGSTLSFMQSLGKVSRDVLIASVVLLGFEAEGEATYRPRVIRRFKRRAQGGALVDYQIWSEDVPGLVNVYPYTGAVPGEVDVYVEATPESSGGPDGIPTDGQIDLVEAAIQFDQDGLATRRPANSGINVYKITRKGFNVQIYGLTIADAQTPIADGIDSYLRSLYPFEPGLSLLPRADRVTQFDVGGVASSIAAANGATFAAIAILDGVSPILSYTLGRGQTAKLGSVSWL